MARLKHVAILFFPFLSQVLLRLFLLNISQTLIFTMFIHYFKHSGNEIREFFIRVTSIIHNYKYLNMVTTFLFTENRKVFIYLFFIDYLNSQDNNISVKYKIKYIFKGAIIFKVSKSGF